jgi:hypothetical protein
VPTRAVIVASVLARHAIEAKKNGALSIIDIVEGMEVQIPPGLPVETTGMLVDFQLVTQLRNLDFENEASGALNARLYAPNGEEILGADAETTMEPGKGHRWFVNIESIRLAGEGLYTFRIRWSEGDESTESTYPLTIAYKITEGVRVLKAEPEETQDEA